MLSDHTTQSNLTEEDELLVFPLSYTQKRLWFLHQMEPNLNAYHIPLGPFLLEGQLHLLAFEAAFAEVLARHESLRSNFAEIDGEPCQIVAPIQSRPLPLVDLRGLSEDQAEQAFLGLARKVNGTAFSLGSESMVRLQLVQLADQRYGMLCCFHHMVFDGWSQGIFTSELGTLYKAFCDDRSSPLPEPELQYGDFAVWQEEELTPEALARQSSFWQAELQGCAMILDLPTDYPRPAQQTFRGKVLSFVLEPELCVLIKHQLSLSGTTLFTWLRSAFAALLQRYSGQTDVIIGSAVANRNRPELNDIIGFFVNTLALRSRFQGDPSWSALLAQTKTSDVQALTQQDLPLDQLVAAIKPPRDAAFSPVFQVMFTLQNLRGGASGGFPGLKLISINYEEDATSYDLNLTMQEGAEELFGRLAYNRDLFSPETAANLVRHFRNLIVSACQQPQTAISQLSLLDPAEQAFLANDWCAQSQARPAEPLLLGICSAETLACQLTPAGTQVCFRVLDEAGQTQPLGVPGRLFWVSDQQLLSTAYIARQRPDRKLELLGSSERRCAHRGRFLSPEPIESLIAQVDGISAARVMVRSCGDTQLLLAYVSLDRPVQEPEPSEQVVRLPVLGSAPVDPRIFYSEPTPFPDQTCIHYLFEACAAQTPDAIAVRDDFGTSCSYRQLNQAANHLASKLRALGAGPERLVAIRAERGIALVIGLVAILKSGSAYVPVDPGYPALRQSYILEDCGAKILLTQETSQVPDGMTYLGLTPDLLDLVEPENPSFQLDPYNAMYVIYTSGSTGRPKGALNSHHALCNRLHWMQTQFCLTEQDRVLQKTPYSFDVSVWEFFWPLISGASLLTARPEGHKDPEYLQSLIIRERITTLHFVPSMLQNFLEFLGAEPMPSLRQVFCSGEALPSSLRSRYYAKLGGASAPALHNLYGPTEAAIDVTWFACAPTDLGSSVPIGQEIANIQCHLVDPQGVALPPESAGELMLGGVGLARGYYQRPALTAERFVPDPFVGHGTRLYRSGDLCRRRSDGPIEFLGRIDHQIKLRGFRIELGEIENALGQNPEVAQHVVVLREDRPGDQRLVAYLSQKSQSSVKASELPDLLRKDLAAQLPEHMVPSTFVVLAQLPLSPNGKIDRNALPRPSQGRLDKELETQLRHHLKTRLPAHLLPSLFLEVDPLPQNEADAGPLSSTLLGQLAHDEPQTPLEKQLTAILEEVLQVQPIYRDDDFFAIGGHSLMAIAVVGRVRSELELVLPVSVFFQTRTVAATAAWLSGKARTESGCLVPLQETGSLVPIFVLHPLGGFVDAYQFLAKSLSASHPVYGIQARGLEDVASTPLETVAEMATHYLNEMRSLRPEGPYVLAGWSSGGMIALEMARQLGGSPELVGPVLLLDAVPPQPRPAPEVAPERVAYYASIVNDAYGLSVAIPEASLGPKARMDQLLDATLRAAQEAGLLPPGASREQVHHMLRIFSANTEARDRYNPVPAYQGPVRLIYAQDAASDNYNLGDLWAPWLGPDFQRVATPGTHRSMLDAQQAQHVAARIVAFLSQTQEEPHA